MIQFAVGIALGFAIGCTFKELIKKRPKVSASIANINKKPPKGLSQSSENSAGKLFNLSQISSLFSEYKIDLNDIDAFPRLLKFIWQKSYLNLLKLFIDEGTSISELAHILNNMNTPTLDITFSSGYGGAVITEEALNILIDKEDVDHSNITSVDDKIRFLLMLSYGKGIQRLKNEYGDKFEVFLDDYAKGNDVSGTYDDIMTSIKSRYNFLL